jgi:DHA1 family bicyclomycin/chloramphenicol resistance-like MFS transporter
MPGWLPLLLGFLTAIGPISTDMYLPAFPAIEAELRSGPGSAQMTLACWFVGLAVGQLVQGTLSDRFGRRGPLMVGTGIFTLASIGCALAPDIASLAVCRALAAFGGAASAVIPRAVVRDLADGHAAARLMSRLMLIMGAAPILAPTAGALLLDSAGWRSIFWISAAYGLLSALLVWRLLPDTLPPHQRLRRSAMALLADYLQIAKERGFITNALMGGCTMFTIFAFLGGAPEVYIQHFGIAPTQFGLLFAVSAAGFIGASQVNPWLLTRFGARRVPEMALWTAILVIGALAVSAFTGIGGFLGIYLPIVLAMGCCALVMPNSAVGALSRHPTRAGSASALMGTLQFCLAASGSALVGALSDGTPAAMGGLMLAGVVAALAMARLRPGEKSTG